MSILDYLLGATECLLDKPCSCNECLYIQSPVQDTQENKPGQISDSSTIQTPDKDNDIAT